MKKVMLSALAIGMFMIGSVYAQTTPPAAGKPATKQESTSGAKSDKSKGHHKGKGKGKGKSKASSSTNETKPAGQK